VSLRYFIAAVKHTVVTGFVDEVVTQVAENDMVALKQVSF